jgi:hypothetical protein
MLKLPQFAALLLLLLTATVTSAQKVTAAAVEGQVQRLVAQIQQKQNANGSWTFPAHTSGYTALNVLALSTAGLTENDPAIRKGIKYLRKNFPRRQVYSLSLYAAAFQAVDSRKYATEIQRAAAWLANSQKRGTWNYDGSDAGDHSVTQFAMLGIKAALDAGIPVPDKVLKTSERHFRGTQAQDGGWSYGPYHETSPQMTGAALSCLYICGAQLEKSLELERGSQFLGQYQTDPAVSRGIKYLSGNMDFSWGYTAYAIERVGIFYDQRLLDGVDWYVKGCQAILSGRHPGSGAGIEGGGEQFDLLFLAKGNVPVLISKIEWGAESETDWNNRRNDARHMARVASRLFQQPLDWQTASLSTANISFAKSPILYLSGYRELQLSDDELSALYAYVEDGGTVVFSPNLNSRTFIRSSIDALRRLYPGSRFESLPSTHALRGMYYNLWKREVPVRVLRTGCVDKRIFIMESDFSLAFEHPEPSKWARQLMANIARFALKEKPLVKRLDNATLSDPAVARAGSSAYANVAGVQQGAITIAQIEHDGEFNPDENAVRNFLGFLRQSLEMPTAASTKFIRVTDPDLKFYPILYTSGHESIPFSGNEKEALRRYLENGGFLIADSCCTLPEFDSGFRSLLRSLFPKAELERIALDSPLYHEPFELDTEFNAPHGTTERVRQDFLWGIRVDERYVVVYSPWDLGCSMDDHLEDDIAGVKAPGSFEAMTNILSYGLSY